MRTIPILIGLALIFPTLSEGAGACCQLDGNCSEVTAAVCSGVGGFYYGEGTSCNEVDCSQLLGTGSAEWDFFGQSVAVSGNTLVVGAPASQKPGAAYVYSRAGAATTWTRVATMTASDGEIDEWFGIAVAVDGDWAAVGASLEDGGGYSRGAVYVFHRNEGGANSWGQVAKLTASVTGNGHEFGRSVALSGSLLAVGTDRSDGAAYVFEREAGTIDSWLQVAILIPPPNLQSFYQGTVTVSGSTVFVGVSQIIGGGVFVYSRDREGPGAWGLVTTLVPLDPNNRYRFGSAVAAKGSTLVVGAFNGPGADSSSGTAYVFYRHQGGTDAWGQVAMLMDPDGADYDRFGVSVAVSSVAIAVGTTPSDQRGSVHVFSRDEGGADAWGRVARLGLLDDGVSDRYGGSVGLDAGHVVVGAPLDNRAGEYSGSAWIYELPTSCCGACCRPDGSCSEGNTADCAAAGGTYGGDGTTCGATNCATVACCQSDGSCTDIPTHSCLAEGGAANGPGSLCSTTVCTFGACCQDGGFCHDTTSTLCSSASGIFQGDASICFGLSCPPTDLLWHQITAPEAVVVTQNYEAALDGRDSEGADDVEILWADGWQVTGAIVKGVFWNGTGPLEAINLTLHDDAGGAPGAVRCAYPQSSYLFDRFGRYLIPIDPPCTLEQGSYWLSTQGAMDSRHGTFGWALEPTQTGSPGVWRNPGDGFGTGCTDWTPGCAMSQPDFSFQLTGTCVGGDCFVGACCRSGESCIDTTEATCLLEGGAYQGDGSLCATTTCGGACCHLDGSCTEISEAACGSASGTYHGDSTICAEVSCPVLLGACCHDDGTCTEVTAGACTAADGGYYGDGTSCASTDCPIKLVSPDPGDQDSFGNSVAIDGDIAIVGSVLHNDNRGAAYVYQRGETGAWLPSTKIIVPDGEFRDYFGSAVAIHGTTAVIGKDDSPRVYERNQGGADTWGEITQLEGPGEEVAIHGDIIVTSGSFFHDEVTIFRKDADGIDSWGRVAQLTPPGGDNTNSFGSSLSVFGSTLVVGDQNAPCVNPGDYSCGGAYVYDRDKGGTDNWGLVQKITTGGSKHKAGIDVAIQGDTIAVGARGENGSQGRVYIYYRHHGGENNWGKIDELTGEEPPVDYTLGASVLAATRNLAVTWAFETEGLPVFERSESNADGWGQSRLLQAALSPPTGKLGASTAISRSTIIVSTFYHDITEIRAAYLWDNLPVAGACCAPGGFCTETDPASCAAAGGTWGGDHSNCDTVGCPVTAVLVDQTDNPTTAQVLIQDFETIYDPSDCEAADDFTIDWPGGWQVNHVVVEGFNWTSWANPPAFNVTIYDDNGGAPGSALCSAQSASPLYDRANRFLVPLQPACNLAPGTYWLGAQGQMDFGDGLFGWYQQSEQNGSAAVWRNPGEALGTGCTTWTEACGMSAPDLSFQLLGTCLAGDCPSHVGACCSDDGTCSEGSSDACETAGGTYHGDGSTCAEVGCSPLGACCALDGSCAEVSAASCLETGGAFHGDGSTCATTSCTFGACCHDAGFCAETTAPLCSVAGGTYQGDLSACRNQSCPVTDLLWHQITSPSGVTVTQDYETTYDALDSEGGDDFEVSWIDGWQVSGVIVSGQYWGGHGVLESMNVTIHADGGATPGAAVCSYPAASYLIDHSGRFLVPLDPPCALDQGTHWISTQGRMDTSSGNFGWTLEPLQTGNPGVWHNPGDGFATGCTDWTAGCSMTQPDFSFQLVGTCTGSECPTGACCRPDGTCDDVSEQACSLVQGLYKGDGTTCATSACGACCQEDGSCALVNSSDCVSSGGSFNGTGTLCSAFSCPLFADEFTSGDLSAWSWKVESLADTFNVFLIGRGIGGDYVACTFDSGTGDYAYLGQVFNEADGGLGGAAISNFGDLYWKNEDLASTVAPYASEDPDGDGPVSSADSDAFDAAVQ